MPSSGWPIRQDSQQRRSRPRTIELDQETFSSHSWMQTDRPQLTSQSDVHYVLLPPWHELKLIRTGWRDKIDKYESASRRLGWSFVPLVMDFYGGIGPQEQTFMNTLTRQIVAQQDAWQRRQAQDTAKQDLSIMLAKELARQLVWSRYASDSDSDDLGIPDMPLPLSVHRKTTPTGKLLKIQTAMLSTPFTMTTQPSTTTINTPHYPLIL